MPKQLIDNKTTIGQLAKVFCLASMLAVTTAIMTGAQDDGGAGAHVGRGQWSTAEGWRWNERVGVIRGFNELVSPNPMFPRAEILRKAKELGYNSVRHGDFFATWRQSSGEVKRRLHELLDEAETNGLSVAPVLFWGSPVGTNSTGDTTRLLEEFHAYVRDVVGEFRSDPRIVLWDVLNEPSPDAYALYKQLILWAREVNPSQPLTTSVLWTGPKPYSAQVEVAEMSDVHNFHIYN